jgi:(p)ppGpp synthase/HD superfamily hydrolase
MPKSTPENQERIEQALRLAIHYHAGQRDKAGDCYMLHLMRVMLSCDTPEAMQVAALHDVLEDTSATPDDLRRGGMTSEVVEAITLLTRQDAMSYAEYVVRLSHHELARQVKVADLQDNYRLDRVAYRRDHADEDGRRIARYILSHDFLTGKIARDEFLKRMAPVE